MLVRGVALATRSNLARHEFIVSPVGLNKRLARNRFTVPPLLLEAASSSADNGRGKAKVALFDHPVGAGE